MAVVAVLVLSAVFGAGDQYLGSLSAHPWAANVSLLSAPWLVLAFAAGATQRDQRRAALLAGLGATYVALLAYGLMTLSPVENAHITVATVRGFVYSERNVLVGGLLTGPLFGVGSAEQWRSGRALFGALLVAAALCLEPLAPADLRQPDPLPVGDVAEVAAGLLLGAVVLARRAFPRRIDRSPKGHYRMHETGRINGGARPAAPVRDGRRARAPAARPATRRASRPAPAARRRHVRDPPARRGDERARRVRGARDRGGGGAGRPHPGRPWLRRPDRRREAPLRARRRRPATSSIRSSARRGSTRCSACRSSSRARSAESFTSAPRLSRLRGRRGGLAPATSPPRGARDRPRAPVRGRARGRQRVEHIQVVTDAALAHLEVDELLAVLLPRLREIVNADTCAVLLLDEESKELVARAALGIEEEVDEGVRIPLGAGFAGKVAAEGRPRTMNVDETWSGTRSSARKGHQVDARCAAHRRRCVARGPPRRFADPAGVQARRGRAAASSSPSASPSRSSARGCTKRPSSSTSSSSTSSPSPRTSSDSGDRGLRSPQDARRARAGARRRAAGRAAARRRRAGRAAAAAARGAARPLTPRREGGQRRSAAAGAEGGALQRRARRPAGHGRASS